MRTSPSAKGVDAKLCQVDDPPLVEGQLSALERRINSDPQHRQNEKIEPSSAQGSLFLVYREKTPYFQRIYKKKLSQTSIFRPFLPIFTYFYL